ncbi:hypothetical protein niasHT_025907 [Heterodera trifolii]|uniref:Uncharacterized protein n=1 Tax=Heterodera trifolii TaxID=157864 RepID=A0ABD2JUV8_9BILA
MSLVSVPLFLLRRILSAILALFGAFFRLITCRFLGRQNRIGELPFIVANVEKAQQQNTTNGDWDNNWNAEPPVAVADQIAQYRRHRQEEAAAAANKAKTKGKAQQCQQQLAGAVPQEQCVDLFSELQPNVKAPKKLLLKQKQQVGIKQRNLFAVQPAENGFSIENVDRLDELGDLDFERPTNGCDGNWLDDEESIELSQIDAFARQQRRTERERRHAARLAEHATAQQQQKRLMLQHNIKICTNNSSEECRIEM